MPFERMILSTLMFWTSTAEIINFLSVFGSALFSVFNFESLVS